MENNPQKSCITEPLVRLELPEGGTKVLLHSCCAPCSGAIIECMVANGIRPAVFFSNSNIVPFEEYELRKVELMRYASCFGLEVIDDDYDHDAWLEDVLEKGGDRDRSRALAAMPERRERCLNCFRFRLLRAANYAAEHGYDVLTTTLASSRWKDLAQVDEAGSAACRSISVNGGGTGNVIWWNMNWRKGGLQPRRSEIIREQKFYNQDWCGCEFSKKVLEI